MTDFILELYSEEIPARMQDNARRQLNDGLTNLCKKHHLVFEEATSYVTPHRLIWIAHKMAREQEHYAETIRGPRIDAPQQVKEGFMRGHAIQDLSQCEQRVIKNITYYFLQKNHKPRQTQELLPHLIGEAVQMINWQKSMRWGMGRFLWVRPLKNILAIYDGQALRGGFFLGDDLSPPSMMEKIPQNSHSELFLPFNDETIDAVAKKFKAKSQKDYENNLTKTGIMLNEDERKKVIHHAITDAEKHYGLKASITNQSVILMARLTERPVMMTATMPAWIDRLPTEVIKAVCDGQYVLIPLYDDKNRISKPFLFMTNNSNPNAQQDIIKGYETLLAARLADADFYIKEDQKVPLKIHAKKLKDMVFHRSLGSMEDKVTRLHQLMSGSQKYNPIHINHSRDDKVPSLAKADLVTGMVAEFPSLEGIMGSFYAQQEGLDEKIVIAIRDHRRPLALDDCLPRNPLGASLAIADKMDSLMGFWLADEKPTGSKDPYALRRTAIGLVRLLLELNDEQECQLTIFELFEKSFSIYNDNQKDLTTGKYKKEFFDDLYNFIGERIEWVLEQKEHIKPHITRAILLQHDSINLKGTELYSRIKNFSTFAQTKQGQEFMTLHKRAHNIVAKARASGITFDNNPSLTKDALIQNAEQNLLEQWESVKKNLSTEVDFGKKLISLASLHNPMNVFFDEVIVLTEDEKQRAHRLSLLDDICQEIKTMFNVDFL